MTGATRSGPPLATPAEPHLLAALWRWADTSPDRPLLSSREGDRFVAWSAAEVRTAVRELAGGLIARGVATGDRVALLSRTSLPWALVDHAIMAAGAVTVPLYETSSASQMARILTDSGARVLVVEDEDHRATVADIDPAPTTLDHVLTIGTGDLDVLRSESAGHLDEVERRVEALAADDLAALLYSSGTTGEPKGCELTHGNIASNVAQTIQQVPELFHDGTRTLAFLPLAHALGRIQVHIGIDRGFEVAFASGIDRLAEELGMVHPTLLVAVPRVFEKVLAGARARAEDAGRGRIFRRAMDVAVTTSQARRGEGSVPLLLRAQHAVFDRLVYGKLRDALGGSLDHAICGGSALQPRIGHTLDGIGVTVLEGYGTTETSPIVTGGPVEPLRIGTVGRPFPATTVRIADDGEILVQGPQVFGGYRGDADTTAAAFEDGWYRTGDLGEFTTTGELRITGRTKEILITASGKNVVPGPLEEQVRAHPLVDQCVVVGEGRPFVGALVTLDRAEVDRFLADGDGSTDADGSHAADDPTDGDAPAAVHAEVDRAIADANRSVSRAEGIRSYRILDEELTVESGLLTPTFKVRRAVVTDRFADQIEELYAGS